MENHDIVADLVVLPEELNDTTKTPFETCRKIFSDKFADVITIQTNIYAN